MNRIDEVIARNFRADAFDQAGGARVLRALNGPLPRQRHSLLDHLPSLLLTRDLLPAWPRVAALACVALFGCMVGLVAPSPQQSVAATVRVADIDAGSLAFDSEPITGVRP